MFGRWPLVVLLLAAVTQADDSGWGTLRGRFVFDGEPPPRARLDVNKDIEVCGKTPLFDESLIVDETTKGVMNVVVYLRSNVERVHPEQLELLKRLVVLKQQKCRFEPHLVVVCVGQEFQIRNDDPVAHNSNVSPPGDVEFSPLIPPSSNYSKTFKRPQSTPIPITNSIHPWMKGYVLIRPDRYVTVSKPEGDFEIKNLPTGELEFQTWQERWNGKTPPDSHPTWNRGRFKATINGDATTDLGTIRVSRSFFAE